MNSLLEKPLPLRASRPSLATGMRLPSGNWKVVQLSRCDGSPSNIAIVVEGPFSGSTIKREDGQPANCCPRLRSHIEDGIGTNPMFPHSPCSIEASAPGAGRQNSGGNKE